MKRILLSILTALTLCVGLSVGYKASPTDHDVTFATNTSRPALPVSPTPVYAPQIAAMEDYQMELSMNEIVWIGTMFVLLAIVLYLLRQDNEKTKQIVEMAKQLRESLPEWGADLLVTGFNTVDARIDAEVNKSATPIDNEMWAALEPRIRELFNLPATPPADPPAVG